MSIAPLEPIEEINKRLVDHYGYFEDGQPNFRIVWSDDQLEKRLVDYTEEGLSLLVPEIREVRKYNYIKHKYVLERLVPVPFYNKELVTKLSYEPVWTFEDAEGNPVPPRFISAKILADGIIEAMWNAGHKPAVKQPEKELNTKEAIEARIDIIEEMLYGNESKITDALKNDSAVGYGTRKRNDWLQ